MTWRHGTSLTPINPFVRLWILTYSVLEFFRRLTGVTWRRAYNNTFVAIRCLLAATFVAVVISTFTECHPASHYWQVIPDPGGPCRQAFAQLITFAICNILNDLALVLFPVPIILSSKMPVRRKVQLILLFSLSLAVVGVTLYRVSNTIARHGSQQYRSLLASVELLFATAASNSLVLGSLVRDRGLKQRRYHIRVAPASLDKKQASPPPMRLATVARHWGSDASLVRELGMGVPRGLRHRADTLNSRANFICQPTPSVSSSHRHRRTQLTPEEEQQLSRDAGTSSHRSSDSSTQKLTGCDDDDDGVVPKPLPPPPPDDCASDIIWYKNTAVSAPAPAAQPNRSMGSVPVSAQQSVTNSGSSVKASLHDEPVSSPTGSDKQSPVPLAVPLCTPPSSTPDHEMKDPND